MGSLKPKSAITNTYVSSSLTDNRLVAPGRRVVHRLTLIVIVFAVGSRMDPAVAGAAIVVNLEREARITRAVDTRRRLEAQQARSDIRGRTSKPC